VLELAFRADRGRGEPVYRQLEGYLRELVAARRLVPGEKLPASRELAETLGLSRNTVNQAYQALVDDGLLHAHVGQGTFVAARAPSAGAQLAAKAAPARAFAWEGLFARRARALAVPAGAADWLATRPVFDFRPGRVDADSLPRSELRRAFARALERGGALAGAEDPRGLPALRAEIARSLVARGIACEPDEVAVLSGAQQAIDLAARALVDPGDCVALEQPGYFGAALAFAAAEAHLVGVEVDAQGLRTDELARLLRARRVKLLFTTPAVQSPTGVALSEERRRELLALADAYQLPILEDDYDSELRCGGPPVPALKNLDRGGQVLYVGTFSKALFPGLRVGYAVAARPLLARLVLSRFAASFQTDVLSQAAVAELLASGALERHVRRVRRLYAERRDAMRRALDAAMPEGTAVAEPAGGTALWLGLPPGVEPEALHAAAAAAGIAYARGEAFAFPGSPAAARARRHLLLGFARVPAARMAEGIGRLGELARGTVRRARRRSA
jgi:GntR family transcriptional regulator / MocR family aminotransferase